MRNPDARILCVPPFVPTNVFHPVSAEFRTERRKEIGIPSNAIVFINHSNMRPIKRVDFCVELVDQIARRIHPRPTYIYC